MTQRDPLSEILTAILSAPTEGCIVGKWEFEQTDENKELLNTLKSIQEKIDKKNLYLVLSSKLEIPFKLTAFKAHLKGACSCPKI